MYARMSVLKVIPDNINGGAAMVTIGFFDERGTLQLEVPQINGKLFPANIKRGDSVVCTQFNARPQLVSNKIE